jgi:hypothetical protein
MHNLNIVLGDVVDATEERVAVGPTPLLDDVDLRLLGGTNFMVGDIDEATTMVGFRSNLPSTHALQRHCRS